MPFIQATLMVIALSMGVNNLAQAQQRNVPLLASACAACHGTNGHSQGGTPNIAALDELYFIDQMMQFRQGKRESTVMAQHANGYTEEEIRLLAHFFAQQ